MDKEFTFFYTSLGFGPAESSTPVPQATLARFRGKLPDQWLKYWELYGWSSYGKGLLWTVNPEEYQSVLDAWLKGTPFCEQDTFYVVARSALGKLFLWGTHSGQSLKIHTPHGMIFPNDQSNLVKAGRADMMVRLFFMQMTKKALDQQDDLNRPLFDRAVKVLGPLEPGQMYGFEPAIVAGGQLRLENLRKVDAIPHFLVLAELGDRRIMRDIVQDARNAGLA